METLASGKQLLMTVLGEAGTGKSTLIHSINSRAKELQPPTMSVTASFTGVASGLLGARTIHSAYHLNVCDKADKSLEPLKLSKQAMVERFWDGIGLVITDECSQPGHSLFARMSLRLCDLFRNNRPMGGASSIIIGDPGGQLDPFVGGDHCLHKTPITPKKFDRTKAPLAKTSGETQEESRSKSATRTMQAWLNRSGYDVVHQHSTTIQLDVQRRQHTDTDDQRPNATSPRALRQEPSIWSERHPGLEVVTKR